MEPPLAAVATATVAILATAGAALWFAFGGLLLLRSLLLLQSARSVAVVATVAIASALAAFLRMNGGSRLMGSPPAGCATPLFAFCL